MKSEKVDLRPLKKWLGKGEIAATSFEVGMSREQASNIISGRSQNRMFVEKFLARVEKNKALWEKGRSESIKWYQTTIKNLEWELSNARTSEHRKTSIERELKKLHSGLENYHGPDL